MAESSPVDRAKRNATGIVSTLVTGVWLAALVSGQDWWLAAMLFGYVVLVPIVAMVFEEEDEWERWTDEGPADPGRSSSEDRESREEERPTDALERLRSRYAEGELTDEQFERKLDRLLETETLEDAEERARRRGDRSADRDGAVDREGDVDGDGDADRLREREG